MDEEGEEEPQALDLLWRLNGIPSEASKTQEDLREEENVRGGEAEGALGIIERWETWIRLSSDKEMTWGGQEHTTKRGGDLTKTEAEKTTGKGHTILQTTAVISGEEITSEEGGRS